MFLTKIQSFYYRVATYFRLFLIRLTRLWQHLFRGFTFQISKKEYWKDEADNASWLSVFGIWLFEVLVLVLELIGTGEIYETLSDFFKYNTRPLTTNETALAKTIYGDSIDYTPIRLDERAHAGPRFYRFCYVSFNIINSWEKMHDHIFIHELMHIWQYQQYGAIYMVRALLAQHTDCGYDYGGVAALKRRRKNGEGLVDFNLEQQGDIISDYFLLVNGYETQWGYAVLEDLPIYQAYIDELGGKQA